MGASGGGASASASATAATRRRCGRRAATIIAFTKQGGGSFAIGIMKPDGSGERILTEGFHNEGPTFAPNGRVLMFFRDPGGKGGPSLYRSTSPAATSSGCRRPGFASDPAWSPLLCERMSDKCDGTSSFPLADKADTFTPH